MTVTPLSWGVEQLPEQPELAVLIRDVASLVLAQETSGPALDDLVTSLRRARTALAATAPESLVPRIGRHADGDGRVYLDHCLDIPGFNPMFPAYSIVVEGTDRATGTVRFPICYEGPAGSVNGGVLGVFFDAVVQHHNCALGLSGATRDLDIRYRRPTPLETDLDFEILRTVDERVVRSDVRVLRGDELLCSATTGAVRYESATTPAISPRR